MITNNNKKPTTTTTTTTPPKTTKNDVEMGESTPLLSILGEDDHDQALSKVKAEQTVIEVILYSAAAVVVVLSVISMCIEDSVAVYVSGILGCGMAPYAAAQQKKLTQLESLRELNATMEHEIDALMQENVRLKNSIDKLGDTVKRLEEVEKTLETIQKVEGQSIGAIEKQCNEGKKILSKLESNLRSATFSNITRIALDLDLDHDMIMGEQEVTIFLKKLETIENMHVDGKKFREQFNKTKRSIRDLINLVKKHINEEVSEKDQVFNLKEVGLDQ